MCHYINSNTILLIMEPAKAKVMYDIIYYLNNIENIIYLNDENSILPYDLIFGLQYKKLTNACEFDTYYWSTNAPMSGIYIYDLDQLQIVRQNHNRADHHRSKRLHETHIWIADSLRDLLDRIYVYNIMHSMSGFRNYQSTESTITTTANITNATIIFIYYAYITNIQSYKSVHITFPDDQDIPILLKTTDKQVIDVVWMPQNLNPNK